MRLLATLALAALTLVGPATAQTPTQTLTGVVTGNVTLDADEVYLIDGEYYVDNGATLTIPAGTVLKGKQTPSAGNGQASVLVVQRGGRLIADGTADAPIIFTAETDVLSDAFDLTQASRSLWGGVVILGNATNNRGERSIEGFAPGNDRVLYGPNADAGFPLDDDDDSGVIRYVSIRHAGFTRTPNEEINGLTFGAVGRGTTVEYVEVYANSDDSFEWFGGTVNGKYLAGLFGGDDDFDMDTGFSGNLQFLFSLKSSEGDVGRCIEADGAAQPFTSTPLTNFTISNLTCVGSGLGSTPGGSDQGGPALKLRENVEGFIANSVFVDWQTTAGGIDLELQPTDGDDNPIGDPAVSTAENFRNGDLQIVNNLFYDFSVGNTAQAIVRNDLSDIEATVAETNLFVPAQLGGISRDQDRMLDPRPASDSPAASGADFDYDRLDDFFTEVDYLGAFAPGVPVWLDGWSVLDSNFFFSGLATPVAGGPESGAFGLKVGPNPSRGATTVRLALDRAQDVRVTLVDLLGREVAVVAQGQFAAGETPVALSVGGLPSGVYVLRMVGETASATTRLSVVR